MGKFLGKPPPLHLIQRDVNVHWRLGSEIQVVDLADGLFLFKFSANCDVGAAASILSEGPILIITY